MRPMLCRPLIGRQVELATLERALADARRAHGGMAVVTGEAGVGKSRLARELRHLASRSGCAVIAGRAVEAGSPVPYRPIAEALQSGFRAVPLPESDDLAPYRSAVGRVLPAWRSPGAAGNDDVAWLLAEGVLRLLRHLAGEAGLLVVLDDLHWADPDSLAVVEYVADNVSSERVLLVATVRDDEAGPGRDRLRRLVARRAASAIHLAPLGAEEVRQMVAACVGEEGATTAEVQLLVERAEGVPFLVEELLAAVEVDAGPAGDKNGVAVAHIPVPHSFADTVRRRMSGLGQRAEAVLRAAAVLGRSFDWRLLPEITAEDSQAVLADLGCAVQAQLVRSTGQGAGLEFSFRHALTIDAIVGELLPHERARLAERALAAVETAHPELPDPWCTTAADLADIAGLADRAACLLAVAGRRAAADGALGSAEQILRRAVGLRAGAAARAEAEHALAEVLAVVGRCDEALAVGRQLVATLASIDAPAQRRAEAHLLLARAAVASTRWGDADHHLAGARASGAASVGLQSRIDATRAQVAIGRGATDAAVAAAQATLAVAERGAGAEAVCEALEVLGRAARLRDLAEAKVHFERAYEVANHHGLAVWRLRALHELGTIEMLARLSVAHLETARALADEVGAPSVAAVIDVQLAGTYTLRFQAEPALAASERCAVRARQLGIGQLVPVALSHAAAAHAVALRRWSMEAAITEALACGDHPDVLATAWGHGRAVLSLLEDDRAAAGHALDEAVRWASAPACTTVPVAWCTRAVLRALEGDDAALVEARTERVLSTPFNRAVLGYAEAICAGRQGDHEAAAIVAASDAVLAGYEESAGYLHLCRRLVAEAALADGWGDPVRWLRAALGFGEQRGYAAMASACRRLLSASGAAVPRRRRDSKPVPAHLASMGLTGREVDVLALLGLRLSNQDMADRLFLSVRTVEKHVERLMDKTGLRSRDALAAVARDAGITSGPGD